MAHPRQEELLAALPVALRDRSVDLSAVGSAEYSFPVDCAEQVFRVISAAGFLILGGDLWRRTESGFEPAHEGWYVESSGAASQLPWNRFLRTIPDEEGLFVTFVIQ